VEKLLRIGQVLSRPFLSESNCSIERWLEHRVKFDETTVLGMHFKLFPDVLRSLTLSKELVFLLLNDM
jgi:hypothetical protein